ncbi:MAG: hypothetical protein MUE68_11145 [Bacteroidetes bacterium]|jgi:hypothetical protein|nr:hypothetical protein [Bacteroidota bacterium]
MKRSVLFWIIAVVITIASAVYQRLTGPTYPVSEVARIGDSQLSYRLLRSHVIDEDAPVRIATTDTTLQAVVHWKRYPTDDPFTVDTMRAENGALVSTLPRQPKAGKLEYYVEVSKQAEMVRVPTAGPITIRFKGDVPIYVLIPHVLAMFVAMLLATRTGLEAFMAEPRYRAFTTWTLVILAVGGFVLGPIMQWFAFDHWWTGWPFDDDVTDNKTLVAFLGWVVAAIAIRRSKRPAAWVLGAAILMLVVYLIPHSAFGSELDYSTMTTKHGG